MSEKVIDFIRSAEQKETLLSKELTFYMKRKIICQSRAEQSRAAQSRAEQSSFCDTTFRVILNKKSQALVCRGMSTLDIFYGWRHIL